MLLRLCEVNRGFYVKAGQFVSSLRQVPKEYISTLSCLQDQVSCNFYIPYCWCTVIYVHFYIYIFFNNSGNSMQISRYQNSD